MRNLILFFTKHYYFLLFLFLEIISVSLILRNNNFQRTQFLNSSNTIAGGLFAVSANVSDYFGLRDENRKLAEENTRLHNQLSIPSINMRAPIITNINDSLHRKYIYLLAKVVNNSTNRKKNYLTLNVGSNQGVRSEMAVISDQGVVGIVRDVSANFSSVMSVLHENSRLPVTLKKFGENAILQWNGKDEWHAQIERIPSHLTIAKGDTVVTSSYSSIFPEGIMVGTIEDFNKIAGNTFYNVNIKLSTNFHKLHYVNIVENRMKEEQETLEKSHE